MSAEDIEASKAPLMDHLIELRSRLIKALLGFGVAFIFCFFFAKQIYNVLVWPFVWVAGPENSKFIYTALLEYFLTQLKLALFGFQYKFDVDRARAEDDLVISREDAVVLVDPASVPFLTGSEVDFVDDLIGASFRVVNPNATASCGCGTSFSI
jgi:hypothetical protein